MANDLSGRDLQTEVTPHVLYVNRRHFMRGLGAVGTLAASAAMYRWFNPVRKMELDTAAIDVSPAAVDTRDQRLAQGFLVDESLTSESDIIGYNNFYEFSTDKNAVAEAARDFDTRGWQIEVDGLVHHQNVDDSRAQGDRADRRTYLSDAMRRGLVDGHSLGRFAAIASTGRRPSDGRSQVCGIPDAV